MMRAKSLFIALSVFMLLAVSGFGQSVSLESVTGSVTGALEPGVLPVDEEVYFDLRLTSNDVVYGGLTNGFQVYSPDGASWTQTSADTIVSGWGSWFTVYTIFVPNVDGVSPDTVGFGGVSLFPGQGLPANTDEVAYRITIGPISADDGGSTICLDSSWYPTSGVWKWGGSGGLEVFPSWDGPHCFTVEGGANQPPVLAAIGSQSVDEGQLLEFNVSATDADGDALSLDATPLPTGAIFTDNGDGTGSFSWTPTFDEAGPYDITFSVSDSTDSDEELVTVTVNNVNRVPVLAAIGAQSIDENQLLSFNVSATDDDGDALTLDAAPLPTGAIFTDNGDGTGSFSWTPTFDQAGPYDITFSATDGTDTDDELVTVTVNNVNRAPVLAAIGAQSVDEGVELSFNVSATDPDGEALTLDASPLPTGALFTDNGDGTGSFTWTPTFDQAGPYDITFEVTDGTDSDNELVTVTVNDVNQPPVLAEIGAKIVTAGDLLEFNVSATDPDGDAITLDAAPLPTGALFTDNGDGTGTFSWQTDVADDGTFDVTFSATDGDLTDDELVTITVGEAPKLIVASPDSLVFTFTQGDVADSMMITVAEENSAVITVDGTEGADWLSLSGVPGQTPFSIAVIADPVSLAPDHYIDSVVLTSIDAVNEVVIPVHMYVEEQPNTLPVVVAPTDTIFTTDECTPLDIAFEVTDADQDMLYLALDGMVENMTFNDNGDGTGDFNFTPDFSQAGGYPLTLVVTDTKDSVFFDFTVIVDECEPGTEGDTVTVATVPAVPGARVVVPVDYANICDLWSAEVSISFNSEFITLDSAVLNTSEFDLWSHTFDINNDSGYVILNADWTEIAQAPNSGNMFNLYFSLAVETPAGFYPLDYFMEPSYTRDCGGGQEVVRPFFIPGGIVVDTSGNYVCGYVVDPEGTPVPGATVQLWNDFPGGMVAMEQVASGTGVFAFSDFNTIPFDLYAYHEGYYPGKVENINFAQSGIMIVLTPVEEVTPTNTWVDFYCGSNTYQGYPLPVGSVVETYDPDGILCGQFMVATAGEYGFLHCYGDDEFADGDQGAQPGDAIRFFINGMEAITSAQATWTQDRDVIELCLELPDVTPHTCQLFEGWNLVSWNVDTESDDIMEVLSSIDGCLETVMGFEQGALTFDVNLQQFSDLWMVDHLSAYWIKVSCDVELQVMGTEVPVSTPIPVTTGWNLVSYLPDVPLETGYALSTIHDDLIVALGYEDDMGKTYVPGQGEFNDLLEMSSCYGYWVKVTQDGNLIYPSDLPAAVPFADRSQQNSLSSSAGKITPTTSWINMYAYNLTVDGQTVTNGSEIEAYTLEGTKVGAYTMKQDGQFGFMPVYGDDPRTEKIDGVTSGEQFYLTVNGVETNETFTWNSSGEKLELSNLSAKNGSVLPSSYGLNQNYPNPFNPTTTISFQMPVSGKAKIEVFNMLGQIVATPYDDIAEAGTVQVEWDGRDSRGNTVASGIYLYRLSADNYTETRKMTLLK